MGRSCLKISLILPFFLLLLYSSGLGRKMVNSGGHGDHAFGASNQGKLREMIELDYEDAGPNFNAKSGYLFPPPPPHPSPGLGD